jgi:hypothetical protein
MALRRGHLEFGANCWPDAVTSSQHVTKSARARIAAEMSPNETFFELYRRKALAAARRSLAIVSALVG